MGGPYCKTCRYFSLPVFPSDMGMGVCEDRTKIIYDRNGNPTNDSPDVHETNDCRNHEVLEK